MSSNRSAWNHVNYWISLSIRLAVNQFTEQKTSQPCGGLLGSDVQRVRVAYPTNYVIPVSNGLLAHHRDVVHAISAFIRNPEAK